MIWIAIDVGCHECGVDSEMIGVFDTKEEAEAAAVSVGNSRERFDWRGNGQSIPQVFSWPVAS